MPGNNFKSSVGLNEDERRRWDHHEAEMEQLAEMRLWLDRLEKQVS
jgi:hypothetical protein